MEKLAELHFCREVIECLSASALRIVITHISAMCPAQCFAIEALRQ